MSSFASVYRSDLFQDQVIFVTGGGSGIGRCTAHELASLGATVVIGGRRREALEQTAAEITESGGRVDTLQIDIRDEAMVEAAFSHIQKSHGRLDGLFNNAGGTTFAAQAEEIRPKGFRAVIELNLTSTFSMCRAAYHFFMRENGGAIVNMMSDNMLGYPLISHVGAAHAGVENLTRSLALEWCTAGVRVNNVAPAIILTSGLGVQSRDHQERVIEESRGYPLGRMGTESEISASVVFLLSPAAAYITGDTLAIAGGGQLHKPVSTPIGGAPRTKSFNGFHLRPDLSGSVFADLMD